MSWNNTVRCGHCYSTGHNKRTCPDLTEQIKNRANSEIVNGEGREGYWQKMYAKRVGVWLDNGEAAAEMKKQRRGGTRRCKYCNKVGHNSATCPELKEAKSSYTARTLAIRTHVLTQIQRQGLGVGALVKIDEYGEPVLWMVQGVNWAAFTHETFSSGNTRFLELKRMTKASTADRWSRTAARELPALEPMPALADGIEVPQNNPLYAEVVGPVSHGVTPPDGWLLGEDINLKEVFKERQSPNHYDNRWED